MAYVRADANHARLQPCRQKVSFRRHNHVLWQTSDSCINLIATGLHIDVDFHLCSPQHSKNPGGAFGPAALVSKLTYMQQLTTVPTLI